jgi:hypothetical protein
LLTLGSQLEIAQLISIVILRNFFLSYKNDQPL